MDKTCYINIFDSEVKARTHQAKMTKDKFDVSFLGPLPAVAVEDDAEGSVVYNSPPEGSYYVVTAHNKTE
jgi:hypothetical protein